MSRPRVALVSCLVKPEPDPDEALLVEALAQRGVAADVAAWDDERVGWSRYALAVLRSTWNYVEQLERFLGWTERAAAQTRLVNPPAVARANLDKHYLAELARSGLPVVPTQFAYRHGDAGAALAAAGWDDVVIKPAVGAGSFQTRRFAPGARAAARAFLAAALVERDMMVQPYLPAVEGYGERALVWIDGEVTHAVRKTRRLAGDREQVSEAIAPSAPERALALAALAPHASRVLYGRVDVVPGLDGAPCIMELELVEPSLFLAQNAEALERFAAAIARRVGLPPAR
jgi:O-ureido-D-serine cyclo-ligase